MSSRVFIALALVLSVACQETTAVPPIVEPPRIPTRIGLADTVVSLTAIGAEAALSPRVYDATNREIVGASLTIESSQPSVATVSSVGVVKAVSNGISLITARSGNLIATSRVVVSQTASNISIDKSNVEMSAIGDTISLTISATDAFGVPLRISDTRWSSSLQSVASVSSTGLVRAISNGTTTISASLGGKSASATLTVRQVASKLQLSSDTVRFSALNDFSVLSYTILDSRNNIMGSSGATWRSSNEAVVTINATGFATSKALGTARLVASLPNGVSSEAVALVQQTPAFLSIGPFLASPLPAGTIQQFTCIVQDKNAYPIPNPQVTWRSLNPDFVSINQAGLATVLKPSPAGSTIFQVTISATSGAATSTNTFFIR